MRTIYECEKCSEQFESIVDCKEHEKLCGKRICSNFCEYLITYPVEINGKKGYNYDCSCKQDVNKHYEKEDCEYFNEGDINYGK